MARCGCAGQTCSCLIQGGDGIEVSGSGTVSDPYVITTDGVDIGGTVQFIDTDTVDFTVAGQGTEAAPYQVSATVIASLGDLSNVDCDIAPAGQTLVSNGETWECGVPALALDDLSDVDVDGAGADQVLTYNAATGQWEPANVSVEPGQVNTDHGAAGDGTASDPVIVQTAAEWNTGELAGLEDGGQTQDAGIPVYIDSAGNVRTPRGLIVVAASPNDIVPTLDPSSIFWNPYSVLLGNPESPDVRSLAMARLIGAGASFGVSQVLVTQNAAMPGTRMQVGEFAADDPDTLVREGSIIQRVDGQVYTSTYEGGVSTVRPLPFAFEQGTVDGITGSANATRTRVVTFSARRFTDTPRTFVQMRTSTGSAGTINTEVWVTPVGSTAAQININRSNSTDVQVWWFAIQDERAASPLTGPALAARQAADAAALADELVPDGLATCHVEGCPNNGIPIPVPIHWTDDEGFEQTNTYFQCGPCGQQITDVVEIS